MRYKAAKRHTIDFVFVLMLFLIFSISSLAVVYIGSQVYSSTVETMDDKFNQNVVMDYLIEKVRQTDAENCINVENANGTDVLCLHEKYEDKDYTTYIYEDENKLKELFISDEETFSTEKGQAVMDVDSVSFSVEKSLLTVEITTGGETRTAYASIVGGQDYETQ